MIPATLPCLDEGAVLKTLENLRDACDFVVQVGGMVPGRAPRPLEAFLGQLASVRDRAVVFVRTDLLDRFFAEAFPRIDARIVLVTAGSAGPTPGPHRDRLGDPRISHWFGQNPDLPAPHPNFSALPIGFMDAYWPQGDQAALLRAHRAMPAVSEKPLRACASFHFNRSHPERTEVLRIVRDMPHVAVEPAKLPPDALWARHADFAFAVSPRGSGFDCHRTWEAILLRTIPIVRSSYVDPLYDGFPVAIVSDWREITPAAMAAWRERFADAFTRDVFERLTLDYWLRRIRCSAGRG
jgi:hypothetical protein